LAGSKRSEMFKDLVFDVFNHGSTAAHVPQIQLGSRKS
jgi:hypothetical protein